MLCWLLAFSCLAGPSLCHAAALGLRGRRRLESEPEHTTCMRVVHSTYDSSRKLDQNFDHCAEPFRVLGDAEWSEMKLPYKGEYVSPATVDMKYHADRLMTMYKVASTMFKETLPHVKWHLDAGALMGAWRIGTITPWDNDMDILATEKTLNSQLTEQRLLEAYGPELGNSTGNECNGNGCRMYALPEDVLLVVHNGLPSTIAWGIFAKLIDRYTGIYVDINCDGDTEETMEMAWGNGIPISVPQKPSTRDFLRAQFNDLNFWFDHMDTSDLFECNCPDADFKEVGTMDSPFKIQVMQPCSNEGFEDSPWRLAEIDEKADCCRWVQDFQHGIPLAGRW